MSLDHLPIQASSVSCERAFSSSAETDTIHQNHISPVLMEALQMLKYSINHNAIDFTSDLLTSEAELINDDMPDLLSSLTQTFVDEEACEDAMDRVMREIL